MNPITYTIPLNPITWKRAGIARGTTFYDTQAKEKLAVGLHLVNQHGSRAKFIGPLRLSVIFYMKLPKSIKDRNLGGSKYCYKTPDLDNLYKFLADAINDTDTIWEDDKQVAHIIAEKIYDTDPRTLITIEELA